MSNPVTHQITNARNNTSFQCEDGESVIDAALREHRIYPYGCRNGSCGACKAELLSGKVDYGNYAEHALTEDEKRQGLALLCQARPLSDIEIDVEELISATDIRIKMMPCRIIRLDPVAQDVMLVSLALPKGQNFNYLPGQYIDIVLRDGQRRSFSLSSLPSEAIDTGLELHVRRVPGGRFTSRVFDGLRLRDLLRFEGPFGTYFLKSDPDTRLLMIAGGTGFSPIKALIKQALNEHPKTRIHLFWGARNEQDLYMNDWVRNLQQIHSGLDYTPVLSDQWSDNWQGETGFVHEAVCRHYDSVSEFDIYASGPPIMIDSVRNSLIERGLNPDRFYFDSFEFAPQSP